MASHGSHDKGHGHGHGHSKKPPKLYIKKPSVTWEVGRLVLVFLALFLFVYWWHRYAPPAQREPVNAPEQRVAIDTSRIATDRANPLFGGGWDSVPLERWHGPGTEPRDATPLPAEVLAAPHACPLAGRACHLPTEPSELIGVWRPRRPLENEKWLDGHVHRGIDLSGGGNEADAIWGGVVVEVIEDTTGSSGRMVVILSNVRGHVLYSKYMHLASTAPGITVGATVHMGEKLGVSGSSGVQRSAPHLHFEVRDQKEGGKFYDVRPLIS